jgi:glycosyltransferase involved in cell wall biosynthesis
VQVGVTGLLFDPEDPGALRGALQALCDETRRREMAGRGPASVAHLLDEDRFVTAHEALYLELIEAANAHQPPGAPDMARQTAQELKR